MWAVKGQTNSIQDVSTQHAPRLIDQEKLTTKRPAAKAEFQTRSCHMGKLTIETSQFILNIGNQDKP
jgi:hypothetical protein